MIKRINLGLDRFSGLYLWALFIVIFTIMAPETFPTMQTAHLLASTQAIAAIAALALLVPMVTGQFDLAIGATANLAGLVAATLQTQHGSGPYEAIAVALGVGLLVGAVNGFIVVKLRVNSFIATLGMGSVLIAVQTIVTGNVEPLPVTDERWTKITQTPIFGFQSVVLFMLVIAVITWWVMEKTPAGRYMRAAGSNPEAARLSGVKVDQWSWIALISSGFVSAIAGVLFVSLTGPSLTFGPSLLLPAFAAVFLGSTQLVPGRINVWGSMLAIFVLATGVQGLQLVSGVQWMSAMFNGVALIAAVALAAGRERRQAAGRVAKATRARTGSKDGGDGNRLTAVGGARPGDPG